MPEAFLECLASKDSLVPPQTLSKEGRFAFDEVLLKNAVQAFKRSIPLPAA